jgi:hypothetical protein
MTSSRAAVLLFAAAFLGWQFFGPPRPTAPTMADLQKRGMLKTPEEARSDTHSFELPGPSGSKVRASFYGLNRLPLSGDDLCAALRVELDGTPPTIEIDLPGLPREEAERTRREVTQAIRASFEQQWRLGCMPGPRVAGRSATAAEQRAAALGLAQGLSGQRYHADIRDEGRDALIIRWAIIQMKGISRVADLRPFVTNACYVSPSPQPMSLAARRFTADCQRLQAAICDLGALASCRAEALVDAGKEYSLLGRLETDERHFRDMAGVLDEAEPLVRRVADRETRTRLIGEIASAFGYAGEAGRDLHLLRRAAEIAQKTLSELTPGPGRFEQEQYAAALDDVAIALSRLAATESDRISATRRAIEGYKHAIAFRASATPDDPSWAAYVNLAANQRDFFELMRERQSIEDAIGNARRSLAILSARPGGGARNDNQLPYVRARLGEALVWRSRHVEEMEPMVREEGFAEAKEHLATAETVFRRMNAQAYLKFIIAAQLLLPDEMRAR